MQNLFHCLYFSAFSVLETFFARFAMGFNGFFTMFSQVLGRFWWVPVMVPAEKIYAYIYEEHTVRASNEVFCVCKLDCKSFLNAFGLKNRQYCLRRRQWKTFLMKKILRLLLGHKKNFGYRLLIYFRQSSFLKGLF